MLDEISECICLEAFFKTGRMLKSMVLKDKDKLEWVLTYIFNDFWLDDGSVVLEAFGFFASLHLDVLVLFIGLLTLSCSTHDNYLI